MADSVVVRIDGDDSGFKKTLSGIGTVAKAGLATVTAAVGTVAAGLGAATKVGMSFEAAMSSVAAISMATGDDLTMLSDAAKQMGETTKFSATQAANALEYLSLAGYSAQESVQALPQVLNLAAAGGMDLAYASDLLTDSMAVMGLGIEDMQNFSDQLAMAASKSNTSVQQLGEAVLVAGGQAKLAGMSVDEMNTALGILADKGIKGSEGGTALRNTLKNLYTPTSSAASALSALGVSTADASGELRPMQDVLIDLQNALSGLSETDKMDAMANIFDVRTIAAASALLDDCNERWDELNGYLLDCDGAAEQMAETMNDNLKGQLTLAASAAEGLGIAVYEGIQEPLKEVAKAGAESISKLTTSLRSGELKGALQNIGALFAGLAESIVDIATAALPILINGLSLLGQGIGAMSGILESAVAAFAAFKVSMMISTIVQGAIKSFRTLSTVLKAYTVAVNANTLSQQLGATSSILLASALKPMELIIGVITGKIALATAAQVAWNAVLNANPIAIVISAVAALAVGIGVLANACIEETEAQKEQRLEMEKLVDETNALCDSANNLNDAVRSGQESRIQNLQDVEATAEASKALADRLYDLAEKENKTNAEKAIMKGLVDELNEQMPDLKLKFDEESGALDKNREAVYEAIEAKRELAKQNALMDVMTEAYKNQYKAQANLKELEQQRKEILEKIQEIESNPEANMGGGLFLYTKEQDRQLKEYKSGLEELDTTIEGTTESIKTAAAEISFASSEMANSAGITRDEIISAFSECAGETVKTSEQVRDSALNFLKVMEADSETYGASFIAAWKTAVENAEGDALNTVESFVDFVLSTMSGMKVTDEDIDLDSVVEIQTGNAVNSVINGVETMSGAWSQANPKPGDFGFIGPLEQELQRTEQKAAEGAAQIGDTTTQGVADSTQNNTGVVTSALEQSVIQSTDAAKIQGKAGGILVGYNISEGLALGIRTGKSNVINAAIEIATAAINSAKNALDIHSPSKVFAEIGKNVSLGLANGIGDYAQAVIDVMNGALTEPMTKTMALYYEEKERLEVEAYNKEYDKRIANAKDSAEVERIKQEYIEKAQKEGQERYLEALKTLAEREKEIMEARKDEIESIYEEIAKAALQNVEDVEKATQSMQDKLSKYGTLYEKTTTTIKGAGRGLIMENGSIIQENDKVITKTALSDLNAQTKALEDYAGMLQRIKERGNVSPEFFQQLADMSIEDGAEFATLLLSKTDAEFDAYIQSWEDKQEAARKLSEELYAADKEKAVAAYEEITISTRDKIKQALEDAGYQIPEKFLQIGEESGLNFEEGFTFALSTLFEKVAEAVKAINLSFTPTVAIAGAAAAANNTTYQDNRTTTLNVTTASTHGIVEAYRQQQIYENHTKGWG